MSHAIIYQPAKSATQSGLKNTQKWVLVYTPSKALRPDHLIGWVGGGKTTDQIRLKFDKRQQALAYAESQGLTCEIKFPKERSIKRKSYADNFS